MKLKSLSKRGAKGGKARTEAKAAAARLNGQKGGRPRKVASDEMERLKIKAMLGGGSYSFH